MNRIFLLATTILLAFSLSYCSNKKSDLPLFLALLGGDSNTKPQATSPSGGSTGVLTPPGSTVQTIDESTVVIHLPPAAAASGPSSQSSTPNPSSTPVSPPSATPPSSGTSPESGGPGFVPLPIANPPSSGPSPGGPDDPYLRDEPLPVDAVFSGDSSSTQPNVAPTLEVALTNNDRYGSVNFHYQASNNIPVELEIRDEKGPISGAVVTIVDMNNPNERDVLFQQTTDSGGVASGSITVPTTTNSVQVNVNLGTSVISTTVATGGTNPSTGAPERLISIDRDIVVGGEHVPKEHFVDSDEDGIGDDYDDYPEDPSRSTLTRYPRSGVNTIAFEDLFPSAGDADLNDYVAFFSIEEDLDSKGKVVSIRGFYQHVARGAGFTHTLNMRLGVASGAKVDMVTSSVSGTNRVIRQTPNMMTLSSADLGRGFQILERSNRTLSTQNNNAAHANNLSFGNMVNFEINFDSPVDKKSLGSAPYDLYLFVENTRRNVHLPNRYFDSRGRDQFLDSNGFPWAIIIPGQWKWQLERLDIRNPTQTGYADFMRWVNSKGQTHKEWYFNVTNPARVFPLPKESSLAGYLAKTVQDHWLFFSLSLLFGGLAIGFYLTKQEPKHIV